MQTKTILLINSEPNVQESIQDSFNHFCGWQVLKASSPHKGLQFATQAEPDAILFDISTTGMDLFAFLTQLRSQSITQHIPVMIMAEAKWLHADLLQEFAIAGVIDYSTAFTKFPQQIAQFLNWDKNQ
ncbi:MAG: response regulator [Snowella sp.]|nr:response regulator [Snowella sp.]